MRVYGFCGKKGSGKDTTASFLKEELELSGFKVKTIAYADRLKEICQEISGLGREYFYEPELKECLCDVNGYYATPREIMQKFGTEFIQGEMGWKQFWANYVSQEIAAALDGGEYDFFFVTDVRFDHEVDVIRAYDGNLIHVTKDINYSFPQTLWQKMKKFINEMQLHESEQCMVDYMEASDHVVNNSYDLNSLSLRCEDLAMWMALDYNGKKGIE
jgi:hypothetical protein